MIFFPAHVAWCGVRLGGGLIFLLVMDHCLWRNNASDTITVLNGDKPVNTPTHGTFRQIPAFLPSLSCRLRLDLVRGEP